MNGASNYYLVDQTGAHWGWRTVGGRRKLHKKVWVIDGIKPNPNYWLGKVNVQSRKIQRVADPEPKRYHVQSARETGLGFDIWELRTK